jgi:predicted anti-sigma-YlaC factor YlaD
MQHRGPERAGRQGRDWFSRAPGWLALAALAVLAATGCSLKRMAINQLGDALAAGGTTFSSDEDPDLVREAVPFSLKLMESLLAESPRHLGLRLAAASGFTQYSYAFVQQQAEELEGKDLEAATALRDRARRLYLRAREHGARGLELRHAGLENALRQNPKAAARALQQRDVPLMYWTAAAWGAAISLSKDNPELVAQAPIVEALMDRALELDEAFDHGALHSFMITYEMSRKQASGDAAARSRRHFERAVELSRGQQAAPFVALAEAVCVPKQDGVEFESLLKRAVAIDVNGQPQWRLANLVMQRRARWLLARVEDLILPPAPAEQKE